jgi:hypothetical protein
MDANGARHLANRIAQQEHWAQAQAVRDGRQPPSDPDGDQLAELGDGYRVYEAAETTEIIPGHVTTARRRFRKTLVDGHWAATPADDGPDH